MDASLEETHRDSMPGAGKSPYTKSKCTVGSENNIGPSLNSAIALIPADVDAPYFPIISIFTWLVNVSASSECAGDKQIDF
jgi:hypothetical protein